MYKPFVRMKLEFVLLIMNIMQILHCWNWVNSTWFQLILGDVKGLTQRVYFIKSGKCELVKKVEMIRSQSPYLRPSLFLPEMNKIDSESFLNKPYGRKMRKIRTETHFLTVLTLQSADYFGIGLFIHVLILFAFYIKKWENKEKIYIFADTIKE